MKVLLHRYESNKLLVNAKPVGGNNLFIFSIQNFRSGFTSRIILGTVGGTVGGSVFKTEKDSGTSRIVYCLEK